MFRRILTILSLLSCASCLAVTGLWIRTYYVREAITFRHYVRGHNPQSTARRPIIQDVEGYSLVGDGKVLVHYYYAADGLFAPTSEGTNPDPGWLVFRSDVSDPGTIWWMSSFPRFHGDVYHSGGLTEATIGFPFGFPCGVLAIPPAILLSIVVNRRLKRRSGLCAKCGYDLRATPDRCPECGAVPLGTRVVS